MGVVPELPVGSCSRAMPVIGMGTSVDPPISAEAKKSAFLEGIKNGYRHFDTAFIYASEQPLGEAIAEALQLGLIKSRDELFITSKLGFDFAERHLVVPAIKMSLQNLQLEYLDLFLIHWPLRLSPGVEMNPFWQQKDLREFCKAKGIQITAYSPLGGSRTQWGDDRVMGCDVLKDIAKAKGKTTAQYGSKELQQGQNEGEPRNLRLVIDYEELNKIDQLPQRKRVLLAPLLGPHGLVLEIDAEI
ncbi:D-galacturonate reductase [Vitis vinifera]|uniref:D-galacturonate reductase n=1 Tax=Vitis vinifera TaxID=29760 RepID=A0A438GQ70_VITVI|nr:D-galacturonate reductase [Vitis vinifera]